MFLPTSKLLFPSITYVASGLSVWTWNVALVYSYGIVASYSSSNGEKFGLISPSSMNNSLNELFGDLSLLIVNL